MWAYKETQRVFLWNNKTLVKNKVNKLWESSVHVIIHTDKIDKLHVHPSMMESEIYSSEYIVMTTVKDLKVEIVVWIMGLDDIIRSEVWQLIICFF